MLKSVILSQQRIVKYLFLLMVILVVASVSTQALIHLLGVSVPWQLVTAFDLDGEQNLPSWFASTLFLVNAVSCAAIYQLEIKQHKHYWLTLAWLLLIMAADEAASLHERTSEPISHFINGEGFLSHGWVLLGVTVTVLAAAYLRRLITKLPSATREKLILGAFLFVLGAIGMEMVGGWYVQNHGYNFSYALLVAIEEGLEKSGLIVFFSGLLSYLSHKGNLVIKLKS